MNLRAAILPKRKKILSRSFGGRVEETRGTSSLLLHKNLKEPFQCMKNEEKGTQALFKSTVPLKANDSALSIKSPR